MRALDLSPFSLVFSSILLAACGGSSIAGIASQTDASLSPSDGGAGTPPEDGSVQGTPTGDDGGSSSEASASDGGVGADAAEAGSCDSLATRDECVTCCDTTLAGGLSSFDVAVEECACPADLCGPRDGGANAGSDASDFGAGACTDTCGTTTAPSAGCEKCILESLGTAADPGPCRATVVTACASSAACKRYVACTDGCPAK